MPQFKNAMEVFKLLEKSNCRACKEKTCLAFASAVYLGKKDLNACPHLDAEIIAENSVATERQNPLADEQQKALKQLQQKIKSVDLSSAADRVNGTFANKRLMLKVLGKDFNVLEDGGFSSDIHINPWVAGPVISYIFKLQRTANRREMDNLQRTGERKKLVWTFPGAVRAAYEEGG